MAVVSSRRHFRPRLHPPFWALEEATPPSANLKMLNSQITSRLWVSPGQRESEKNNQHVDIPEKE